MVQHVLAYNELFNFLHRSPYLLAQSLAIGDNIKEITSHQMLSVIHTISTGLYGNAILSKDVDMVLRLLRDLIEIQIIVSENPRRYAVSNTPDQCGYSQSNNHLNLYCSDALQNVADWVVRLLPALPSFARDNVLVQSFPDSCAIRTDYER